MRKISSLLLLAVVIFSACNQATFKKGKDNLEYKIIADGSGPKVKDNDYMQLDFATYYNTGKKDSLLNDSRKSGMPAIEMLNVKSTPPAYFDVLKQLRKGDSVAFRILTDSVYKGQQQMPPFFKKGHYLLTTIKILNIFTSKEQADSARAASMAAKEKKDSLQGIVQLGKDDNILKDYFTKNHISNVKKAEKGTYVEILQPGTGNNIDTANVVKINYTGRTLDGKVFDSNTDPSKPERMKPLKVNVTGIPNPAFGTPVILGWTDGLKLLNKGAKAKFYIPSSLAYGPEGPGGPIGPNAILIFDIEVVDVLTKDQAIAENAVEAKKMQELQKHYMDSVSKARNIPVDSLKK